MKDPYQLVQITWKDAFLTDGWHAVGEVEDEIVIQSCGWLIKKTRGTIVIAFSRSSNEEFGDYLTIPAPWVLSMRRIGGKIRK